MNKLSKFRKQKISYVIMVFIVLLSLLPQKTIALTSETPVENIDLGTGQEVSNDNSPIDQTGQENSTTTEPLDESPISAEEGTNLIGNEGILNEASTTLTDNPVDSQRPYITGIFLSLYDMQTKSKAAEMIDILRTDEMTRVSLDTDINITIDDNEPITTQTLNNPIILFNKDGVVDVTITPTFDTDTTKLNINPVMDLTSRTTYYIMFNQRLITGNDQEPPLSFTDNSLNTAFPIIKKFTTVSEVVLSAEVNHETENWEANPHGYYTNNVNTCANCHGTHKSDKSKLDNPDPTKIPNLDSNAANYCMACHDGTTAAPLPDVSDYVSDHTNPENPENPERKPIASTHNTELKSNTGSCTSCHNPHLTWSEENPNLLKDHFVYEHEDSAVDSEGKKIGEIDSRKQLCENCHDNDTSNKKELAFNNTNGDAYKILHYRKSSAAIGTISNLGEVEDYDLCFSCHNPDKEVETTIPAGNKIFDILSFYADTTSGHIITAKDGSQLNGPIPCSECHETHAATNKKLLKERFGHENQKGNFELLDSWSPSKEIEFCIKCHNGDTAIYGVNGNLPSEENHPKPTPNAEGVVEPEPACSSCHGGTGTPEDKARRAVHSPLEYSKSLPTPITPTE